MGNGETDFVNTPFQRQSRRALNGFTEEQVAMRNCLNTLKAPSLRTRAWRTAAAITCCYCINLSSVSAQSSDLANDSQTVPVAEDRATEEPVFRVSKLNPEESSTTRQRGYAVADARTNLLQTTGLHPKLGAGVSASPIDNRLSAKIEIDSQDRFSPVATPTPSRSSLSSKAMVNALSASSSKRMTSPAPHPLDRAIEIAKEGLVHIQANVRDYSTIMVKRERIDGVLGSTEYMQMKIRCPRTISGQRVPFSVYIKSLKPKKTAGREVIWVDGQDDNKLIAHETGLLGMKRFYLDPTGWVAMQNNKYPIYDAGIENLIIKLIEKAEKAKAANRCLVNYRDNAEIMKRKCSLIELIHEEPNPADEFHKAHVFIDKELNLPVRYVAFDWPKTPGGKPEIIEEYTYVRVNVNQGYKDIDFSPENPKYKFPRR